MEEIKKKIDIDSPAIFWTRFVFWIIFSLVIPILFINYRYGLFNKISGVSLSGWGTLVGIVCFVFIIILLRYILHSKTYAYYKQIIKGVLYLVAPCSLLLWLLYVQKNTIEQLIQVIGCCVLSWTIAICINPMPRWTYLKSQGEFVNIVDMALARREKATLNK